MAHRRTQIIDAIVAIIQASASIQVAPQNVFKNRSLSLSEEQDEMPAVCVNRSEDQPDSELGNDNVAFIDSLLSVTTVGYVLGDSEGEVVEDLDEQARHVQAAILADQSLGLGETKVIGTRYGGSGEPQIDTTGERTAGSLESRWTIHYRMNIADPGD